MNEEGDHKEYYKKNKKRILKYKKEQHRKTRGER